MRSPIITNDPYALKYLKLIPNFDAMKDHKNSKFEQVLFLDERVNVC